MITYSIICIYKLYASFSIIWRHVFVKNEVFSFCIENKPLNLYKRVDIIWYWTFIRLQDLTENDRWESEIHWQNAEVVLLIIQSWNDLTTDTFSETDR